jgi:hypothetical protein
VGVDTSQVGLDKNIRANFCVVFRHTEFLECAADKLPKFPVVDARRAF